MQRKVERSTAASWKIRRNWGNKVKVLGKGVCKIEKAMNNCKLLVKVCMQCVCVWGLDEGMHALLLHRMLHRRHCNKKQHQPPEPAKKARAVAGAIGRLRILKNLGSRG